MAFVVLGAAAGANRGLRPSSAGFAATRPSPKQDASHCPRAEQVRRADPNQIGHGDPSVRQPHTEHGERRPAWKRIIVGYGFWVFLLSDIIMFTAFFLHFIKDPNKINNVMPLAFGVLIVMLLIGGSLGIMGHLNHSMIPTDRMI